jgi:predicted transcriptional regulator
MANLHISDELDQQLQQTAERLGCSKDALVQEALLSRANFEEAPLTEAEIDRMRHSIAQLDRGEHVTSEQVDIWFASLFKKLEAR